jgi:hypothetical protein
VAEVSIALQAAVVGTLGDEFYVRKAAALRGQAEQDRRTPKMMLRAIEQLELSSKATIWW